MDGFNTSCGFGAMNTASLASSARMWISPFFGVAAGRCEGKAWWDESGRAWTVTMERGVGMSAGGEELGGVRSAVVLEGVRVGSGRWVIAP